jgi:hypothetical protein
MKLMQILTKKLRYFSQNLKTKRKAYYGKKNNNLQINKKSLSILKKSFKELYSMRKLTQLSLIRTSWILKIFFTITGMNFFRFSKKKRLNKW